MMPTNIKEVVKPMAVPAGYERGMSPNTLARGGVDRADLIRARAVLALCLEEDAPLPREQKRVEASYTSIHRAVLSARTSFFLVDDARRPTPPSQRAGRGWRSAYALGAERPH